MRAVAPKLHVQSAGSGPDLVLLHGWGLHSGFWGKAAEQLAATFCVHAVDLPGHGGSGWDPAFASLDGFAQAVVDVLPKRCILLGWSLGGLIALRIAALCSPQRLFASKPLQIAGLNEPQDSPRLAALILVCSTPKFVAGSDWPHGVPPRTLEDFAQRLADDYIKAVQDFLTLQVQGESHSLSLLRQMKQALHDAPAPSPAALCAALDILRDADMRPLLPTIHTRSLVISGMLDRMTPAAAGQYLARHLGQSQFIGQSGSNDPLSLPQLQLFKRTAHAPFLSDPAAFVNAIVNFWTPFAAQNPPQSVAGDLLMESVPPTPTPSLKPAAVSK